MDYLLSVGDGGIFPYQNWFCEAWRRAGGACKRQVSVPHAIRAAFGHAGLGFATGVRRGRLLVCGSRRIDSVAWPWCYAYEIVPVIWDLWPGNLPTFARFIRNNRVRTLFCTSSQQVEKLRQMFPQVNAVWLPEGIDIASYPCGGPLVTRPIDVLEYGRRNARVHDSLVKRGFVRDHRLLFQSGDALLFPDFPSMTAAIRQAKISICHPQCDTNPQCAGTIETLTQRYWEGMLSGTLIVGRAPRELINLCGYNPVVELQGRLAEEIEDILAHIGDYQVLVDRNRAFAERNADWSCRIPLVKKALG